MAWPPVYSTRFILGQVTAAAGTLSYVVPAGRVAVIRSITLVKQAAATASNAVITIDPAGPGAGAAIFFAAMTSTTVIESRSLECNVVMNAGDTLLAQRSSGGDTNVSISGFLLTAL